MINYEKEIRVYMTNIKRLFYPYVESKITKVNNETNVYFNILMLYWVLYLVVDYSTIRYIIIAWVRGHELYILKDLLN